MTSALVAATIAALSFTTHTDTTFAVPTGTRLELENYGGDITVDTWSKNSVRIDAEHSTHTTIVPHREGTNLRIDAEQWRGGPTEVDYHLTLPTWMALHVNGVYSDISITGSRGEVRAETVNGDIEVVGGRGTVAISSVDGSVSVSDAVGHLELNSVNDAAMVKNVEGDLTVEGVNGDIMLEDVRATNVDATTVSGDIRYVGVLRNDGHYHLATHNGDIEVAVPEKANVTVSVSTFSGDFDSTFPLKLTETKRGRRFKFTLGTGAGELGIDSFQGTIRLARPNELAKSDNGEGSGTGKGKGKSKDKDKDRDKDEDSDDDGDR